jgi:hypothetical protein
LGSLGVATVLGEALLPALESTTRDEAASLYEGTYSNIQGQLTITTDPFEPGLGVINWYNHGQNMLNTANMLVAGISMPNPTFDPRLYSTGLEAVDGSGNKQVPFIAIFEDLPYQVPDTMFVSACGTWIGPTGVIYGSQALDEFVFTINPSGQVISVLNSALRVTLNKN